MQETLSYQERSQAFLGKAREELEAGRSGAGVGKGMGCCRCDSKSCRRSTGGTSQVTQEPHKTCGDSRG